MQSGDRVIVALSGGADSVCLLRVLIGMGVDVVAAHCNFHLRGDESNRDEAFVRRLCDGLGVELHVRDFRTREYSEEHHVSIEMAARELRYEWFEELRLQLDAACIAVAHHEDDVAETVLLNLVRGTGVQGVAGMAYRNGHIIRPMLGVSRSDVLDYLRLMGQDYVTDSTNLEDDCKRNILRLRVMPELRRMNPSASHSIALSARHLRDVAQVYEEAMTAAVARVMDGDRVSLDRLARETAPCSVLYECLKPYGFTSAAVEDFFDAMDKADSGRVLEAEEWRVVRDRTELIVAPVVECQDAPLKLEDYVGVQTFLVTDGDVKIDRSPDVAMMDADRVEMPLSIRRVQTGDRFRPFGMKGGTKLLSDYMTDRKFSLLDKERQLVVVDARGRIVWVVGERMDERCRITSSTRMVMKLTSLV